MVTLLNAQGGCAIWILIKLFQSYCLILSMPARRKIYNSCFLHPCFSKTIPKWFYRPKILLLSSFFREYLSLIKKILPPPTAPPFRPSCFPRRKNHSFTGMKLLVDFYRKGCPHPALHSSAAARSPSLKGAVRLCPTPALRLLFISPLTPF